MFAEWEDVELSKTIPYNLHQYPLQIKTDGEFRNSGAVPKVHIVLHQEHDRFYIWWRFNDKKYEIGRCEGNFMTNVPATDDKIWTITKSPTSLTISCNDVEVVKMVAEDVDKTKSPQCVTLMSREIKKITFHEYDTASDQYRPAPGNIL